MQQPEPSEPAQFDRRWFLAAGALAAVAAACGNAATGTDATAPGSIAAPPGSGSTSSMSAAPATAATAPATSAPGTTSTTSATTSTGAKQGSTTTTKSTSPSTTAAPSPAPSPAPASAAPFFVHGPDGTPTVALTFHTNGDVSQVEAVLAIVEEHGAVLTAFIVGNWLDANPSMGKRLADAGHELANHTYTHPSFEQLRPAAMATEITRCRDAIARVTGSGGRWFRLSGTEDGTATPSQAALVAAHDAGYAGVVGFDVDPYDYKDPGKTAVIERTLSTVKAGSIISLHMGHAGTIDAIGPILDGLARRSLRPVTLSTLLG